MTPGALFAFPRQQQLWYWSRHMCLYVLINTRHANRAPNIYNMGRSYSYLLAMTTDTVSYVNWFEE